MKAQHGKKSVDTITVVSSWWKRLTPSELAFYHERAANDKLRYYNEKAAYAAYLERVEEAMANKYPSSSGNYKHESWAPKPKAGMQCRFKCTTTRNEEGIKDVPPCTAESIARLASQLDPQSIDFLIRAFK